MKNEALSEERKLKKIEPEEIETATEEETEGVTTEEIEIQDDKTEETREAEENNPTEDLGLNTYLKNINKYKNLSPEEERQLFRIIKGENTIEEERKGAINSIVEAHLPLVAFVAKNFFKRNSSLDLDDLIQAGNEGLLAAIDKFDDNKGNKFSTYAYWWISNFISRSLNSDSRTVVIPQYMLELRQKYNKAYQRLEQKLGHKPKSEEIMNEMNNEIIEQLEKKPNCKPTQEEINKKTINIKKVHEIEDTFYKLVSLHEPLGGNDKGDNDTITIEDFIPKQEEISPEARIDRVIFLPRKIEKILREKGISDRDIEIFKMRFGLIDEEQYTDKIKNNQNKNEENTEQNATPKEKEEYEYSLQEVAQKFNLSIEGARIIINKIIKILQNSKEFKDFLHNLQ